MRRVPRPRAHGEVTSQALGEPRRPSLACLGMASGRSVRSVMAEEWVACWAGI